MIPQFYNIGGAVSAWIAVQPRARHPLFGSLDAYAGEDRWRIAWGYRKSLDCHESDYGQDAIEFRMDHRHVVAVVADGVSQSFFGDLAARYVGHELCKSLWNYRSAPLAGADLQQRLEKARAGIESEIARFELPLDLSKAERESLERKRSQVGSHAVFVAVVVDLAQRTARFYRVGDAAMAFVQEGDTRTQQLVSDDKARWTSLAGLTGPLLVCDVPGVRRVMLFSDGWRDDSRAPGARLRDSDWFAAESEAAQQLSSGDDVAVLEIVKLSGPSAA